MLSGPVATDESYVFDGATLRIAIGQVMDYWANPDLTFNE